MAQIEASLDLDKLSAIAASKAKSMSTDIEKTLKETDTKSTNSGDIQKFADTVPTYISLLGLIKNFGEWAAKMDFQKLNSKLAPFYIEYGKFAEKIHGISSSPEVVKDLQNSVAPIAKVSALISQLSKTSVDINPETLPKMLGNLSQSLNVLAKSGDLKNSKKHISDSITKLGVYLNDINKLLEEEMLTDPKKATNGFNAVVTIFEDYDKILGYIPAISKHAIRIMPFTKIFKWSNDRMFSLIHDLYDRFGSVAKLESTTGEKKNNFDPGAICKMLAGVGKVFDSLTDVFQKVIALEAISTIVKHTGKFIKAGLDTVVDIMCSVSDLFNPKLKLSGNKGDKSQVQYNAESTPDEILSKNFKIVSAVKTIFELLAGTFVKIVACAALAIPVAIGCIPVSAALLALKGVVWEVCKLFGDGGEEAQSQQAENNMNAIYWVFSSMASAFLKIIIAAALAPIVVVAIGSLIITFSAIKGLMWIMGHLFGDDGIADKYNSATAGLATNGPMAGIKMLGVFALGMLSLLATFLLVSISADKIAWAPVLGFLATALIVFGAFALILKLVDTVGFDKESAIAIGLMSLELVAFALEMLAVSFIARQIGIEGFGLILCVLVLFTGFAAGLFFLGKFITKEALLMATGACLVFLAVGLTVLFLGTVALKLGVEGLLMAGAIVGCFIGAIFLLGTVCKNGITAVALWDAVGVLIAASVAMLILATSFYIFTKGINAMVSIYERFAKIPDGSWWNATKSAAGLLGFMSFLMGGIITLSVTATICNIAMIPFVICMTGIMSVIGSLVGLVHSTAAMEISYHDANGKIVYRKLSSSDLTKSAMNVTAIVDAFKGIMDSIFKDEALSNAVEGMGYFSRSKGEKILILLNESVKPLGKIMELIKNLAAFEITVHVGGKRVTRRITNSDLSAASDNLSTVMKKYTEIVGAVVSDGNLLKSSAGSSFFNYSSGEEVMRLLDASVSPIAKIFKVVSELSVFEVVSHDAHGRKHYQKLTSSLLKKANGNLKTTVGGFIGIVKAVTTGKNSTELYSASMGSSFFSSSKGESIMKLLDQSVRPIGKIVGMVSKMAAGEYAVHGAGGKIEYHHIWNKTIIDAETMTTKIMTAFGRIVSATCNVKNLQSLADDGVFSSSNGAEVMKLLENSIKPISAICSIVGSLAAGEYAVHDASGNLVYHHLWQKTINDAELSGKKIITAYSNVLNSMNRELLPKVAGNNFWSNATFTNSLKSQSAAIAIMAGTLQGIANGKMRVYNGQGELMRTVNFNYKEIAEAGKSNKLSNMIEWYTNAVTGFNGGASRSGLGFFLRFNGEYEHMAKTTASIVKTVNGLDPGKFRIYTDTFKEMNKFTEKMGKNMDKLIDAIGNKLVPQLAKLTSPKPADAKLPANGKQAHQHTPVQPAEQKPTPDTQLIIDTLVATIDDLKQTISDLSDNTYKVKIKQ